jgi:hypothetical protein
MDVNRAWSHLLWPSALVLRVNHPAEAGLIARADAGAKAAALGIAQKCRETVRTVPETQ